ncbi:hypothetical protein K1719_041191 [Acacia pycnantha]|nr:hypothetical protein K1719_041191 [Acacia pycnantha]
MFMQYRNVTLCMSGALILIQNSPSQTHFSSILDMRVTGYIPVDCFELLMEVCVQQNGQIYIKRITMPRIGS